MPGVPALPRRSVLRCALALAVGVPVLAPLVAMLRRVRAQARPAIIAIPPDVPAGLSVVGAAL
ncbi:MAG: hypothetical protein H6Q10_2383, partial [Acidobacteria bacterium]|nr:hypothetical protein [Acidobacteriota bacterium]